MNILFALYNDFNCNSASHVHCFANELQRAGHDCIVAVPFKKETVLNLGTPLYKFVEFAEVIPGELSFNNGLGPEILHAWTPREILRSFCLEIRKRYSCRLFIHMEDNEWHLLACALGLPWQRVSGMAEEELDALVRPHLSHPYKGQDFLESATGVTVIIDRLKELVPNNIPVLELWPSADPSLFRPLRKDDQARRSFGIPRNSTVISYTGNVHAANAHEVRSLYLAVAMLNREGHPTTLVRTGTDWCPFLGPGEEWGRRYSIELGMVPRSDLPTILSLADILVQPGRADLFNDYRFPSKLPEFLSAGRPVILPNANLAHHMTHRVHAYVLPHASGLAIAGAVKEIMADPALRDQLARGALEFFHERLSWQKSAEKLSSFYAAQDAEGELTPVAAGTALYSQTSLAMAKAIGT